MKDLRINPGSMNEVWQNVVDELSKMYWAQSTKVLDDENVEMDSLEHNRAIFAVVRGTVAHSDTVAALLTLFFDDPLNMRWEQEIKPIPTGHDGPASVKPHGAEMVKLKERMDVVIEYVNDRIGPFPRNDGLWWADEDYYPIRPMLIGEEPDLKPEPWCTVVDGTTGEPINEAKKKPTQRDEELWNPNSFLIHNAKRRVELWVASQFDRDDLDIRMARNGKKAKATMAVTITALVSIPDDYFEFELVVDVSDPMKPTVTLGDDRGYDMDDPVIRDVYASMVEMLEQLAEPVNHPSNAWWADENLYPVRPVYDGEASLAPPKRGWTTVDPVSYDAVEVEVR